MAMSSSMRRRSGLTDEWIGCGDIGSSSRAEGRPFMLGARPELPQPLNAAYECTRPRPKHPSRGAGSCMGATQLSKPWHRAPRRCGRGAHQTLHLCAFVEGERILYVDAQI